MRRGAPFPLSSRFLCGGRTHDLELDLLAVTLLVGVTISAQNTEAHPWQQQDLAWAEAELRKLIRRYPLFADARAALSGLLWQRGASGEAESHWAAAAGLDRRYRQRDWLQEVRRWPPQPTQQLMAFLALEDR